MVATSSAPPVALPRASVHVSVRPAVNPHAVHAAIVEVALVADGDNTRSQQRVDGIIAAVVCGAATVSTYFCLIPTKKRALPIKIVFFYRRAHTLAPCTQEKDSIRSTRFSYTTTSAYSGAKQAHLQWDTTPNGSPSSLRFELVDPSTRHGAFPPLPSVTVP